VAGFGGFYEALDVDEPLGQVHLLTELGEIGLDLCVLEVHLLAGVVDERGRESAVVDEGSDHVPVAVDLEDEAGVLVAGSDDLDELVGRGREEVTADVGAGFAHDGLAAEVVEAEDEIGLLDGVLLDGIEGGCSGFGAHWSLSPWLMISPIGWRMRRGLRRLLQFRFAVWVLVRD